MLTGPKQIILADIAAGMQDADTGDRKKRVTRARVLAANVELVGVNTAQLGQVQGFKLKFSVTVGRVQYSGEKYLYSGGMLYTIATLSKSKSAAEMLLNVEEVNDGAAKAAVEEWMHANLPDR